MIAGDSNATIDEIALAVPEHGLNIALVDPFRLRALKFATLERLARFKRMDLVIHFPTMDIKRNLAQNKSTREALDDALGTKGWQSRVTSLSDVSSLIDILKEQLRDLGYGGEQVRSQPIKNSQNVPLYYLVYASKHAKGGAIWQSITRNTAAGQRGFGFE